MSAGSKYRMEAADAVTRLWDTWHASRPDTNDPEFWNKYADHDEALADAYRALRHVTDDRGLAMGLQDAEELRREQAKETRRRHAQQAEAGTR